MPNEPNELSAEERVKAIYPDAYIAPDFSGQPCSSVAVFRKATKEDWPENREVNLSKFAETDSEAWADAASKLSPAQPGQEPSASDRAKEIWPEANSWKRGPVNPGDSAWVIFEKRHGADNRIIGRGDTEDAAWENAAPAQPEPQKVEDVGDVGLPQREVNEAAILASYEKYPAVIFLTFAAAQDSYRRKCAELSIADSQLLATLKELATVKSLVGACRKYNIETPEQLDEFAAKWRERTEQARREAHALRAHLYAVQKVLGDSPSTPHAVRDTAQGLVDEVQRLRAQVRDLEGR